VSLAFGTDGIRGVANKELTVELSLALGRAAASVFGHGTTFLVGRDSRQSGDMLQAALTAGITSAGDDVVDLGVLPTPAVAHLSAVRNLPAAMISASHNPYTDNGIKFFLPGGRKLSDEIEEQLEAELRRELELLGTPQQTSRPQDVGTLSTDHHAVAEYLEHLRAAAGNRDLNGLRVVVDCANGAASQIAGEVMASLGAEVFVINNSPDGTNINRDSGSTHMDGLRRAVVERRAAAGLALDGDADRVLAADEMGNVVDGDHIIALLAANMKTRGHLRDNAVVVTVMSNLGFRLAMEREGIRVVETAVGDRYVLEALAREELSLGGEQSGHVIVPQHASTGDGLLTGLLLLQLLEQAGRPLSELASEVMTQLPQVLRNVGNVDQNTLADTESVWKAVAQAEESLGREGRVLLRPSGTEPVVRVMVEAPTVERAQEVCDELCEVVSRELGMGR
jgi:phosphoglucosamine mutase